MARTPLMRALQRLSYEHSRAQALEMDVSEFRARASEAAYSRREFLAERPAGRTVRRADRFEPQDHPPARAAVRPGDGRPARRPAERDGGHVLHLRQALPEGPSRRRLPTGPPGSPRPGAADEL